MDLPLGFESMLGAKRKFNKSIVYIWLPYIYGRQPSDLEKQEADCVLERLVPFLLGSAFSQSTPGQIIVLENGTVIEQGPHEVLLSKAGRYAQLWGQQNNSPDGVDPTIKLEA
ncbi:ABC transporter B family member 25 [Vitis vinifera]|uniref:ABC transporter B family member 25 n=1 Tax=Vitis vinifera TaxID=29760 RepID=A0A438KP09_VITVI|nr:ABC transporter B family member 25 [Vitis vinifera]RVX22939.1 ABC transporter B family member 25 [Vitis vinifera]